MADITFVTAPIGGGKSLYGTMLVCEELEKSDRFIVTNIPLILNLSSDPVRLKSLVKLLRQKSDSKDEREIYWTIQEYCDVFIKRPIDISKRLIWLTPEQSREFFLYLPTGGLSVEQGEAAGLTPFRNEEPAERACAGWRLPTKEDKLKKWLGDFKPRERGGVFEGRGCYYVMDEFHKLYGARDWQQTGPQLEDYMSELRKLNDDLVLITQHPEKVDKNCRRNATEWYQVQNMSKTHLFMGVSLNNRFRYHWYNQPEMPGRADKPTKSGWYRIDGKRRFHFLYRTMAGSSISGGTSEVFKEDSRKKGRNPVVWVFALAAIICGAYFLPRIVQTVVAGSVKSVIGGVQKGAASAAVGLTGKPSPVPAAPPAPVPVSVPVRISPTLGAPVVPSGIVQPPASAVYCTGYVDWGSYCLVALSDGRMADSRKGEVQAYGERFVKVFGDPRPVPVVAAQNRGQGSGPWANLASHGSGSYP